MNPDRNDQIFLESTGATESPAELSDGALSPKLGINIATSEHTAVSAQYSRGFRAPPYSSVNSGFTNLGGGYQTLANPNLEAETSDQFEFGLKGFGSRGSISVNYYENRYDDFIEDFNFIGISPQGLSLFQPQNLGEVKISGIELAGDFWFNDSMVDARQLCTKRR